MGIAGVTPCFWLAARRPSVCAFPGPRPSENPERYFKGDFGSVHDDESFEPFDVVAVGTYERGIWGGGLVSGKTRYDVAANDDTISPYWRNPLVGKRHQNFTPIRITPLINNAVTDQTVRERGISDLEVHRQPQGIDLVLGLPIRRFPADSRAKALPLISRGVA